MVKPVYKIVISSAHPNLILSVGFFRNISLIYNIKKIRNIGDLYSTPYNKGIRLIITFFIRIAARRSVIKKFTYYINLVFYFYYFSRKIKRLHKTVLKTPDIFIVKNDAISLQVNVYSTL